MESKLARSEKLELRLTPADKQMLRCAAQVAHRPVSDFVLESALARAEETMIDRSHFGLNAEKWAEFIEALEAPPRHHARLHRLLSEPSIFEQ